MKAIKRFEDVVIRKPLYHNFVYIRDSILYRAINQHLLLRIRIPQGMGIADPKKWIKTGKRMEKVFKIPNHPMILYGNYVHVEEPRTKEEILKDLSKLGYSKMNIQKEIIKMLSEPISARSFQMKSYKRSKQVPPYFVLFKSAAERIAQNIIAVCNKRNEEIAEKLRKEDAARLVKKFGHYTPEQATYVIEGFLLARNYILNNKMRF